MHLMCSQFGTFPRLITRSWSGNCTWTRNTLSASRDESMALAVTVGGDTVYLYRSGESRGPELELWNPKTGKTTALPAPSVCNPSALTLDPKNAAVVAYGEWCGSAGRLDPVVVFKATASGLERAAQGVVDRGAISPPPATVARLAPDKLIQRGHRRLESGREAALALDRSDSAVHALSLAGETLASVHETTEGKTKLAIWALGDEGKLKRTATIDFADLQPTIQVVGDSQVVVVDQLGRGVRARLRNRQPRPVGVRDCEFAIGRIGKGRLARWIRSSGVYRSRRYTER